MNRIIERLLQPRWLIPLLTMLGACLRLAMMPIDLTIGDDIDDYITQAILLTNRLGWTSVGNIPDSLGAFGYLPGFPVLISLLYPVTGDHWLAARIISICSGAALIPMSYLAMKHFFGEKVSLLTAMAVAINSNLIAQSARSATEMPFLLFVLISLWFALKAVQLRRAFVMVFCGILCGLIILLRPEGLFWMAALAVFLARSHAGKDIWLPWILGVVVTVGALGVMGSVSPEILAHYTVYVRHKSPSMVQMGKNAFVNSAVMLLSLFDSLKGFLVLALAGILTLTRERKGTLPLWALAIVLPTGLYLFYPTYQNASHEELPRYICIILPWVIALGARGWIEATALLGHRLQYGLGLVLLLGTMSLSHTKERALYWADLLTLHNKALDYLETKAPENSLVYSPGSAQRNWAVTRGKFEFCETEPSSGEHYLFVTEPSQPYSVQSLELQLLAEFHGQSGWKGFLYKTGYHNPKQMPDIQKIPKSLVGMDKWKNALKKWL